ncbi:MAG TPA: UbiX family flavin prenyltransferase [Rhizomicrobium sp.]|nr:UbiX family flavin prenyltransferase [Rhizomicrobium sp.]
MGISGASGVAYGIRLLEALAELQVESHLVVTKAGEMTIALETGLKPKAVAARADFAYAPGDIAAPIASGTFRTRGMIVAPCSVRSWSEIATGVTTGLLSRAADVTLKERRPLILIVRETPLHAGHLRTLAQLAEMGATILPPLPAFYDEPHKISDFVDQIVGRALDLLGYDWPAQKRWNGRKPRARD